MGHQENHSAADDIGPVLIDGNAMPSGGAFYWLKRPDGMRLRYGVWAPENNAKMRGTFVVVPGRTEFIEKYFEVVSELLARSFAVVVLDVRGQGLSSRAMADPLKGHVEDFQDYVDDFAALMDVPVIAALPYPLTVLAHSMGGNISLRFMHDRPGIFARAILSAPMTVIQSSPLPEKWARLVVRLGAWLWHGRTGLPGSSKTDPFREGFESNVVTSDERRFNRGKALLKARPRLALGPPTFGWMGAAVHSMGVLQEPGYIQAINVPILIGVAEYDQLIDVPSQRALAWHLPQGRHVMVKEAQHEILMESDDKRAVFWQAIDAFLDDTSDAD